MKKVKLQYTRTKADKAGKILRDRVPKDKIDDSLKVLSNWRGVHSYPMHIFKMRLKRVSKSMDKKALSAQRLKRASSIIKKLQRVYDERATMKLTQMQDIAGVRAIMSNVKMARKLYVEKYLNGDLKHKLVRERDYVTYPKPDGYRSFHAVYKYKSDKEKKDFNELLVEVQVRSKLQHIWATAVESVSYFTGQAIKSNIGEEEWKDFFRLVSAAFAKMEKCPNVPNTPLNEKELYLNIKELSRKLDVIKRMKGWANYISLFEKMRNKKAFHYFLLELDTIQEKLVVTSFSKRKEEEAIERYNEVEERIYDKPEYDVVLVGADSVNDLKKAYPNYFLDTKEFLELLEKIVDKY